MDQQEEEIAKQTVVEDEKPKATLADKLKEQKKARKKKIIKRTVGYGFLAFFSYAVYFLFKPFQASAEFGICRTMLELNVPYPHTIYVSEIKHKRNNPGALELWYTHTDAFGEFRMESFTCKMGVNPQSGQYEISEIKKHKVAMEPQKVTHLNSALPYFMVNPLILNHPLALPDSIENLTFEFDKFRRIQLTDIEKR